MTEEQRYLEIIQADIAGIHAELKTLNNRTRKAEERTQDLWEDVYGNEERKVIGIKELVTRFGQYETGAKALLWFFGIVGIGNAITLLFLWVKGIA